MSADVATVDTRRWRHNLHHELDGAAIYRALARAESEPVIASLYQRLASAEARHARVWAKKLREAGETDTLPRPSLRASLLIAATARFGPDIVGRSVAARELWERDRYEAQDDPSVAALVADERLHGRVVGRITRAKLTSPGMARLGNAMRAAVLGVNDGLVSNLSLVMGVIGASGDTHAVIIAGFAGMLAGSLSMGLGEWLSVQSSRELYERQSTIPRGEETAEEIEEEKEIAEIYTSQGMAPADALLIAQRLVRGAVGERDRAADDDEMGDFGGSAWIASVTSFAMFASGALVPLIPFAFASGTPAAIASALLTGLVLFLGGCAITMITGKPLIRTGLRSVVIGYAAAAVLFSVGRLLGVALQ